MQHRTLGLSSLCLYFCVLATTASGAPGEINWQQWEPHVFAGAKAANKLIMVNVGYEGCTACRFMDEHTFKHQSVINLLNEHFVAVQVDSEAQPDIGERYSDWAWPATAFMHPDGTQIFALRGSRRAEKFLNVLNKLIERHEKGTLKTDTRAPYGTPSKVTEQPLQAMLAQVRNQLDRSFDDERGGWGSGAKVLEYPGPTLQLFMRGHFYNDKQSEQRARKTADGFSQQSDDIWGGIFYASIGTWTNTIKEKRLETQAAALRIFSHALQITSDDKFRTSLIDIDRYLQNHLLAENGLYFSSQKDLNADLKDIDSDEYYKLDDAARRAVAYPKTDHATYTDLNARIALGYIRAYQATGEDVYLQRARAVMNTLVAARRHDAGWFIQLPHTDSPTQDERAHLLVTEPKPYLRTQAYTGLALLNLFQATNNSLWLDVAKHLGTAMTRHLEDPELGGFYAATKIPGTPASLAPRKPLEDNAVAANFFYLLGVLEKDPARRSKAEKAIRAVATPEVIAREGRITGNLAMALELLTNGYVEMSVVGDKDDESTLALFDAAHRTYEPRKIVHFEAPGRYPKRDSASLYICNDNACSLPITDPNIVSAEAEKFTPAAFAN